MEQIISNIPNSLESELKFKTSRSSGAGGQHVNKVETRISVIWNIEDSEILDEVQKKLIGEKLKSYINKKGVIQLHDESSRSQITNKERVIAKLKLLVSKALKKEKVRKGTKPTKESQKKKRKEKEMRSKVKETRKKVRPEH